MKKLGLWAIVGAMLFAVGCSCSSEPDPIATFKAFNEALIDSNEEVALQYVIEGSEKEIKRMCASMKFASDEQRLEAKERVNNASYREEIDGDTAKVYIEEAGINEPVILRKIDGQWKLDATK